MGRSRQSSVPLSARSVVAGALGDASGRFPDLLPIDLDTDPLHAADRRLAVAVHRTALQRWITLEFLLDRHLRKPVRNLEPSLRGVLLSAAAQIVCFDRLPLHAVVDESVELAKAMVRPGAAKLTNAVLRRLSEDVNRGATARQWAPARDQLPADDGAIVLKGDLLPDPADLVQYLSIAASCPAGGIRRWIDDLGKEVAIEVCRHGVATPPTIVAAETGMSADALAALPCREHQTPGYLVWEGPYEQLTVFLAGHPARRVQDPASAEPVQATASLDVRRIVDYCAGKGTKTLQLAAMHHQAQVTATDIDSGRREQLARASAEMDNVTVLTPERVAAMAGDADLLVLDVPCTNTATLARRPEARYRFSRKQLSRLVRCQRQIMEQALSLVRPGGWVLYCTCSLEPSENQEQAAWLVQRASAKLENERLMLPKGHDTAYHDGSYLALIRLP